MSRRGNYKKKDSELEYIINMDNLDGTIKDLELNSFTNTGITTYLDTAPNYATEGFTDPTGNKLSFGSDNKFSVQSGAFSVKVWINTAYSQEIYAGKIPAGASNSYWEWSLGDYYYSSGFKLMFAIHSGQRDTRINIYTPSSGYKNRWVQIIGTYDGSLVKEGLHLYADGSLIAGTQQNLGGFTSPSGVTSSPMVWGGNLKFGYAGKQSQQALINKELTDSEVLALYNAEKGYFGL